MLAAACDGEESPILVERARAEDAPSERAVPIGAACEGDGRKRNYERGEVYCMTGRVHPDGYITMACLSDNDCPGATRCVGLEAHCVVPCESDSDCRAPSACTPLGGGVAACMRL